MALDLVGLRGGFEYLGMLGRKEREMDEKRGDCQEEYTIKRSPAKCYSHGTKNKAFHTV
jgi:hypothetical protein